MELCNTATLNGNQIMMTIDKNVLGRFEGLALSHIIINGVTVEKKSASFDTYAGSLMCAVCAVNAVLKR